MHPTAPSGPPEESPPQAVSPSVPGSGLSMPVAGPATPWHASLRPGPREIARSTRLASLLCLVGLPVGLLWWLVAPRRAYEVTADGAFAVVSESEAAVGSDGWLLLMLTVVAVVSAAAAWWGVRPRGPFVPIGLAVGMVGCGLLAWLTGSLLGPGPTAADLSDVGTEVLGPLQLGAIGVLVVGPFVAVAGYAFGVCLTRRDDLG